MKHWIFATVLAGAFGAQAAPAEWVAAQVVKVDAERARVTLDHARIKSIDMEPMVMPFKVDSRVDLKRVKPGDKVRFTFRNHDGHLVVNAMEMAK